MVECLYSVEYPLSMFNKSIILCQLSASDMGRLKTKPWKKARRRNSSKQSVKVRKIIILTVNNIVFACSVRETRPGGVLTLYMTGGSDRASYCEPKQYMSLKFYTQNNYWHQKSLPQKIQDLNISILIYSVQQTLRTEKICDQSLDPKNTKGVIFQPPKIHWTLSCILRVPPLPPWGNECQLMATSCLWKLTELSQCLSLKLLSNNWQTCLLSWLLSAALALVFDWIE